MISTMLQDLLVEELKRLFDGFLLNNVQNQRVPINIYPQYLPAKKHADDSDHFPYIVVRFMDGEDTDEESPTRCRVIFIAGVYDENDNFQGYKDVINIIEKIRQHLLRKRIFGSQFEVVHPIKWAVNEEDYSPFFFGALETNWNIATLMQDDEEGLI